MPSLTYQPLPLELLAMCDDLEALGGGGAARVGHVDLHVRVRAPPAGLPRSYISVDSNGLTIRDPRCGDDVPASHSLRRFKLPNCLGPSSTQEDVYTSVGKPALDWVWSGFNAAVVAFGQTGTGKTHTLYGVNHGEPNAGLVSRCLSALFTRTSAVEGTYSIGLCCWELRGAAVVDLLSPSTDINAAHKTTSPRPVCVTSSLQALEALAKAQRASLNWTQKCSGMPSTPLPNRAHMFTQVMLYSHEHRRVSSLHVVDLVGFQPLSARHTSPWQAPEASAGGTALAMQTERDRRLASQQLLGFTRLISEMSQRCGSQKPSSTAPLVTGRDSALAQQIGTLLAGNCKTHLLATVSFKEADYLDTVNTLRMLSRARPIYTPCMQTQNVSLASLNLLPGEQVLSAIEQQPISATMTPKQITSSKLASEQRFMQPTTPPVRQAAEPSTAVARRSQVIAKAEHAVNTYAKDSYASTLLKTNISRTDELRLSWRDLIPKDAAHSTESADSDGEMQSELETASYTDSAESPAMTKRDAVHGSLSPLGVATHGHPTKQHPAGDLKTFSWEENTKSKPKLFTNSVFEAEPSISSTTLQDEYLSSVQHKRHDRGKTVQDDGLRSAGTETRSRTKASAPMWELADQHSGRSAEELDDHLRSLKQQFRRLYASTMDEELTEDNDSPDDKQPSTPNTNERPLASPEGYAQAPHDAGQASGMAVSRQGVHTPAERLPATAVTSACQTMSNLPTEAQLENLAAENKQLNQNYEAVLAMLHREGKLRERHAARVQELEGELMECSTSYEVKLDSLKLKMLDLQSKCRLLEAGTGFTDLFEKYDREVAALTSDMERLRQENASLYEDLYRGSQRITEHLVGKEFKGDDTRIANMRRTMRRLQTENMSLSKELTELHQKDRQYELHKRTAEETTRKLSKLQRDMGIKDDEHQAQGLLMARLQGRLQIAEAAIEAARQSESDLCQQLQDMSETARAYKEELQRIKQQARKETILARLDRSRTIPTKRASSGYMYCIDLVHKVEREVPSSPRIVSLVERLLKELEAQQQELQTARAREEKLLVMLSSSD
eukprot:jgi/Chlat1/5559/Chrsp369S08997